MDIQPDWPLTHFDLGANLSHLGRDQEAIACYREALRLQPDYLDAQNNLANALRHVGRYEEAAIYYAKAMRAGPQAPRPATTTAACSSARARSPRPSAVSSRRSNAIPATRRPTTTWAMSSWRTQRTADAIVCYRKALALQPDFAEPASLTRALSGRPSPPYDPRR